MLFLCFIFFNELKCFLTQSRAHLGIGSGQVVPQRTQVGFVFCSPGPGIRDEGRGDLGHWELKCDLGSLVTWLCVAISFNFSNCYVPQFQVSIKDP